MIEESAVLLFAFFGAPGEGAPFKLELEMVVGEFLLCRQAAGGFAGDADDVLVAVGDDGEDLMGSLFGPMSLR